MRLRELIEWLERQDAERTVTNGFGEPHSDRGDYSLLAFEPVKVTTFGRCWRMRRRRRGGRLRGGRAASM